MTDKSLALHGSLNLKVNNSSVDIDFKNKKVFLNFNSLRSLCYFIFKFKKSYKNYKYFELIKKLSIKILVIRLYKFNLKTINTF